MRVFNNDLERYLVKPMKKGCYKPEYPLTLRKKGKKNKRIKCISALTANICKASL